MPELPEVEHVRRTLEARLVGRAVERVRILRRDVIAGPRDPAGGFGRSRSGGTPARITARDLLGGAVIERLERRGKRLAIVGDTGRALDIHLGMTGALPILAPRAAIPDHAHILWTLGTTARNEGPVRLVFRDPRRFGGVWTCDSFEDLRSRRWGELGPDALTITGEELARAISGSRRAIKAALLDQSVLAGVGNIYADEALFAARIHPEAVAGDLPARSIGVLARAIRDVLREAVDAGGSTIRDFEGPEGDAGSYQDRHAVYGRGGSMCPRCVGTALVAITVAQRTTTFCPGCQSPDPHRVPTKRGHLGSRIGVRS